MPVRSVVAAAMALLVSSVSWAESPQLSYLFPAGGQRGQKVAVRVGGLNLYERCGWEATGTGLRLSPQLRRMATRWFEGPMLPLPDSQRQEDYPQDMAGEITIAADASIGPRRVRVWTAEGASSGPLFAVGDLPEVVEEETDGDPIAVPVTLPVTINGRIFPREDIDVWSFIARKGQPITCEVQAARLHSPLDARLEVTGPDGRVVAENDDNGGPDSLVSFIAPADGTYRVQISDANRAGSQRHVYRLTVTTTPHVRAVFPLGGQRGTTVEFSLQGAGVEGVRVRQALTAETVRLTTPLGLSQPVGLDVDTLPETTESTGEIPFPGVGNGQIARPGEVDVWRFTGKKGQPVEVHLRAARLGSALRGVIELIDEADRVVQSAEYGPGDPILRLIPTKDGPQRVRVRDQVRSRGGSSFGYRLRIATPVPDFQLQIESDTLSVVRGKSANLKLTVVPQGGFAGAIALEAEGLPEGVKFSPAEVKAGQTSVNLVFTASATARIDPARVRLFGKAQVGGVERRHPVRLADEPTEESLLLGVGLPVPFKVVGTYDLRLIPRGTVYRKRFRIERNGYEGPLEVRLADRQSRHLQGVSGPTLTIGSGVSEFDYPVTLPAWMETGRTSRACVVAVGRVRDGDREHLVGFSSQAQNEQMIAVVETGRLGLEVVRPSVSALPGGRASVPFTVRRGKGLTGPVQVELIVPEQVRDTQAAAVVVPATQTAGTLTVSFGAKPGPYLQPLTLRARVDTPEGPVTAECALELVVP
ncbi:MAG: PPC domain-containing protein [Gemmataceae bacterium]